MSWNQGQNMQEIEWDSSSMVEKDGILGLSSNLEMSVRDLPQVIKPEQNLVDTIQGHTGELNLTETAQVRKSEYVDRWC